MKVSLHYGSMSFLNHNERLLQCPLKRKDSFIPRLVGSYYLSHLVAEFSPFRKEVIQPQIPLGLPCFDFILVINFTLGQETLDFG